jgi:hypothetical protein
VVSIASGSSVLTLRRFAPTRADPDAIVTSETTASEIGSGS